MTEVISIPSPSAILDLHVHDQPPSNPASHQPRRSQQMSVNQDAVYDQINLSASGKPKQTKSRNGCVTCKLKRLKCDEKKPSCDQCARRNVTCGGYKKDFKWRPFEEQNVGVTASSTTPARSSSCVSKSRTAPHSTSRPTKPPVKKASTAPSTHLPERTRPPPSSLSISQEPPPSQPSDVIFPFSLSVNSAPSFTLEGTPELSSTISTEPDSLGISTGSSPGPVDFSFLSQSPLHFNSSPAGGQPILEEFWSSPGLRVEDFGPPSSNEQQYPVPSNSMPQSWWNASLYQGGGIPVSEMQAKQPYLVASYPVPTQTSKASPEAQDSQQALDDDDIEEIVRGPNSYALNHGSFQSTPDVLSLPMGSNIHWSNSFGAVYRQPHLSLESDEMVIARFDRKTCGIMSVKDGHLENPWRTLVMPLMHKYSLVYHTVASMACLQYSTRMPQLLQLGKQHFDKAFSSLKSLASNNLTVEYDVALAAMLGLAFSEGWGASTVTGTDYIKQSKLLMYRAVDECQRTPRGMDHIDRVKFLCRTWIYIDVIARLTSVDDDDSSDFEHISKMVSGPLEAKVDPLMGVASTLFPIIGRVANLVKQVCKTKHNTPATLAQASNLKLELEMWQPMAVPELIQDETSTVDHNVQTANAYKWATLLYLHQAVPEIPMESSESLAEKALECLSKVPLGSRTVIVQIYPLLAAGCEAQSAVAKEWVIERWDAMKLRMSIGNVDRCADVVREVWRRREEFAADKANLSNINSSATSSLLFSSSRDILSQVPIWLQPMDGRYSGFDVSPRQTFKQDQQDSATDIDPLTGQLRHEYTVRGRLHWVGVMKDWKWEVLLG